MSKKTHIDTGREFAEIGTGHNPAMDHDRPLQLKRPCSCGCDARGGLPGVGYITGGGGGAFFTVWIQEAKVYEAMREVLRAQGIQAET